MSNVFKEVQNEEETELDDIKGFIQEVIQNGLEQYNNEHSHLQNMLCAEVS
jgi:hypothetical protein